MSKLQFDFPKSPPVLVKIQIDNSLDLGWKLVFLGFKKKLGEYRRDKLLYWGRVEAIIKLYKDS